MPVGRGRRTSDICGRWRGFMICDKKELHQGVVVDGVALENKKGALFSNFLPHPVKDRVDYCLEVPCLTLDRSCALEMLHIWIQICMIR